MIDTVCVYMKPRDVNVIPTGRCAFWELQFVPPILFPNTNFVKTHRAVNQVQRRGVTALFGCFPWNLVSHLDCATQTLGVFFIWETLATT